MAERQKEVDKKINRKTENEIKEVGVDRKRQEKEEV